MTDGESYDDPHDTLQKGFKIEKIQGLNPWLYFVHRIHLSYDFVAIAKEDIKLINMIIINPYFGPNKNL